MKEVGGKPKEGFTNGAASYHHPVFGVILIQRLPEWPCRFVRNQVVFGQVLPTVNELLVRAILLPAAFRYHGQLYVVQLLFFFQPANKIMAGVFFVVLEAGKTVDQHGVCSKNPLVVTKAGLYLVALLIHDDHVVDVEVQLRHHVNPCAFVVYPLPLHVVLHLGQPVLRIHG